MVRQAHPAFSPESFPVFVLHDKELGYYYGFPTYGNSGLKIGERMPMCSCASVPICKSGEMRLMFARSGVLLSAVLEQQQDVGRQVLMHDLQLRALPCRQI